MVHVAEMYSRKADSPDTYSSSTETCDDQMDMNDAGDRNKDALGGDAAQPAAELSIDIAACWYLSNVKYQ